MFLGRGSAAVGSVGRQPAAELKLLYFTAGARLKGSRPYARPSAQSFPLFYNDGTGCAELQLNKYQPILPLQRGNCLLYPPRSADNWCSWSHLLCLGTTAEPGSAVTTKDPCSQVFHGFILYHRVASMLPWSPLWPGTLMPMVLINHFPLGTWGLPSPEVWLLIKGKCKWRSKVLQ